MARGWRPSGHCPVCGSRGGGGRAVCETPGQRGPCSKVSGNPQFTGPSHPGSHRPARTWLPGRLSLPNAHPTATSAPLPVWGPGLSLNERTRLLAAQRVSAPGRGPSVVWEGWWQNQQSRMTGQQAPQAQVPVAHSTRGGAGAQRP
uniref:Uncharacterized protein n=1 Tax=Pipistrellus kuhlii TaxID=59472 RepID=A0A7J7RLJ2_PIPKU|nr:hypothetical protein mPipKuh1_010523 [Pipistrellus kuhlii]